MKLRKTNRRRTQIRRGHALVEYAMILGLVTGLTWGAWHLFEPLYRPLHTMHDTFAVNDEMGGNLVSLHSPTANTASDLAFASIAPSPLEIWAVPIGVTLISLIGICYSRLQIRENNQRDRNRTETAAPEGALQSRLFEKRQHILRVIQNDAFALLEGRIRVRYLMTTDVTTVSETTTVFELRSIMKKMEMRHLIVCDAQGNLAGVISDRDLSSANGKLARDVMTREALTVDVDSLVSPAATMMIERHISMLPVVDQGKLCGIITTTDLVLALQSSLQVMVKLSGAGTRATDKPTA